MHSTMIYVSNRLSLYQHNFLPSCIKKKLQKAYFNGRNSRTSDTSGCKNYHTFYACCCCLQLEKNDSQHHDSNEISVLD